MYCIYVMASLGYLGEGKKTGGVVSGEKKKGEGLAIDPSFVIIIKNLKKLCVCVCVYACVCLYVSPFRIHNIV